jgi:hypothetical protein
MYGRGAVVVWAWAAVMAAALAISAKISFFIRIPFDVFQLFRNSPRIAMWPR